MRDPPSPVDSCHSMVLQPVCTCRDYYNRDRRDSLFVHSQFHSNRVHIYMFVKHSNTSRDQNNLSGIRGTPSCYKTCHATRQIRKHTCHRHRCCYGLSRAYHRHRRYNMVDRHSCARVSVCHIYKVTRTPLPSTHQNSYIWESRFVPLGDGRCHAGYNLVSLDSRVLHTRAQSIPGHTDTSV